MDDSPSAPKLPLPRTPGAAPANWQECWDQPLIWPRPAGAAKPGSTTDSAGQGAAGIDLAQAALVIIDVDKKSFDNNIAGSTAAEPAVGAALRRRTYEVALPNMIALVGHFRAIGRPVLFVQWGWHRYQYPPLDPRAGELVVYKRSRGAFATSDLHQALTGLQIKTCVFAGADTAFCVASTVRGAIDHGYQAVLAEDACICLRQEMHEATIKTLGWGQAHVCPTAEILAAGVPAGAAPPAPKN